MTNNRNNIDKTLITAYQDQRAPSDLHDAIVENFLLQNSHGVHWSRWPVSKMATVAIVVCGLLAFRTLFDKEVITPTAPSATIRLSISTTQLRPLPSLSSVTSNQRYTVSSLGVAKPPELVGQYRKTINAANKIL